MLGEGAVDGATRGFHRRAAEMTWPAVDLSSNLSCSRASRAQSLDVEVLPELAHCLDFGRVLRRMARQALVETVGVEMGAQHSVACSHQAACAHWAPRVWSRAMGRRGAIVLLLGVLIALTPLAQASPPDPTWIPGFYDDADYDDVVLAITGAVAVGESGVMDPVGPGAVCLGPLIPSGPRPVSARALDSHPPRAPPHPLS